MSVPAGPVAQIDLSALRGNFALARRLAGERDVIAVIKADAYGHGALPAARALVQAGCTRFALARVGEAALLRDAGVDAEMLVLGGVQDAAEAAEAAARRLVPVVHHTGAIELLAAAGRARGVRLPVHVEVDTGMRRAGPPLAEACALLDAVAHEPALLLAGVFTHLARADEPDLAPSQAQIRAFRAALGVRLRACTPPVLVHVANSAGLLLGDALAAELPEAGAVRPGLLLYGVSPFAQPAQAGAGLRPVMRLATRVVDLRRVAMGEAVGYGATWHAPQATWIATLAIGYADGVPWSLANRGCALLRGRRLPIVGRVSMDLVTLDAGELAPLRGEEAVLIGAQAGARIAVEEVAAASGTIAYEVLAGVGPRVPRVYIDGEGAAR